MRYPLFRIVRRRKTAEDSGYTLLEYCAGAAVIAGVVFGALHTLGGNMEALLAALGTWADNRAAEILVNEN